MPTRGGSSNRRAGVALLLLLPRALAMRLVLQRVKQASVSVDRTTVASIGGGVLVLVGIHESDTAADLQYCAKKLCAAKLWENENEKSWRKSVKQMNFEVLLVSQARLLRFFVCFTTPTLFTSILAVYIVWRSGQQEACARLPSLASWLCYLMVVHCAASLFLLIHIST